MDPSRTYEAWGPQAESAVLAALRSHVYLRGPAVPRLEKRFQERFGVAHALGVGSGTQALVMALRACFETKRANQRDVLVPAFTFVATAGAVVEAGGRPVFVDVDPSTFLIDPASVAARATPETAAVVPVHLFGAPVDLAPLQTALEAAGARDVFVLEDAAQAIDATLAGKPVGSLGDAAAFSFYPSKNLAAAGDAGLLTTNDSALAGRLLRMREHGAADVPYLHPEVGTNGRMDEIQALVLEARLAHLAAWTGARRAIAARYGLALAASPLRPQQLVPGAVSAWHLYVVRTPRRDALRAFLAARGIATGVYYPVPLSRQPCFASFDPLPCPNAERLAGEVLALPCFPGLREAEQARVLEALEALHAE